MLLVRTLRKVLYALLVIFPVFSYGQTYAIPASYATTQWALIGTFAAPQGGVTIAIDAFIHQGYNATNSQDSIYHLNFKTSNTLSVDGNGFAGNGTWYAIGQNLSLPQGSFKWVANAPGASATSYSLYMLLPLYTENSNYRVTASPAGTWTHVGSTGLTDPGSASSSVLVPGFSFNVLGGNVGIGTNSPDVPLRVGGRSVIGPGDQFGSVGTLQIADTNPSIALHYPGNTIGYIQLSKQDNQHNTFKFRAANAGVDGLAGIDVEGSTYLAISGGSVGIGTNNPAGKLEVAAPVGGLIVSGLNLDPAFGYLDLNRVKSSGALVTGWNRIGGNGEADFLANRGGGTVGGFAFFDVTNDGVVNHLLRLQGNGNVGIGTTDPGAKLDVAGSVKISGPGASMTFPDNSVQSTAWNGTTCGGDYAESVDVTGDRRAYEPGDVLVIDPKTPGKFFRTAKPYSKLVAGIYSTKPGLTGRRQGVPATGEEVPMAMLGIVPTKVSTENGAIEPGDLLVTSSTNGYAMKGTDASKMMGSVIGKAIGYLDKGTGVIEVLVTLQ